MIDIIVYHTIICKLVKIKYPKYLKKFRIMQILLQWHISNFGIISGIVGFKTNKYSNLLYLFLYVLYHSLTIHYIIIKFFRIKYIFTISQRPLRKYFFPVITNVYWYFSTYFKMYLFLPIINKGLFLIYKGELVIIILSMVGILFIWKDLMSPNPGEFCSGRSTETLLVYFIIGAFIGKYYLNDKNNKNVFYYLLLMIIFISASYISYYLMFYKGIDKCKLILKKIFYNGTNSIAMLIQSISIILIFIKINYKNSIAKFILFFGRLSFSAYIIHTHLDLRYKILPYLFKSFSPSLSFHKVVILLIIQGTLVFIVSALMDYCRFIVFSILRIRQICLYFEKLIFSLCNKINENKNN